MNEKGIDTLVGLAGGRPDSVRREIVLRHTGEVLDPADAHGCAKALAELRQAKTMMAEAERALTGALEEFARQEGGRTVSLPGGGRIVVEGGDRVQYDGMKIELGLRALGVREERRREIVSITTEYKVDARQAKAAAKANPEYAKVIESATQTVPGSTRIKVEGVS